MANEKEWQQDISNAVDLHTYKLSNHETRIGNNETELADHEKRINNIETTSDVGQFATRVQAIEDKNTEQDTKLSDLTKSVDENLQTAKQYTETQLANYATKIESADALNLAKQYTDQETSNALNLAKQYTRQETSNALNLAKQYTGQETSNALNLAKQYTGQETSNALNLAKQYTGQETSNALNLAKQYTDQETSNALNLAKQYTGQETSNALNNAKSYIDNEKTKYLPLTGGNLSGSIWINSNGEERNIGCISPSGYIYLYAHSQNKGIYTQSAEKVPVPVIVIDKENNINFYGKLNGKADTAGVSDQTNVLNTRSHPTIWAQYIDFDSNNNVFYAGCVNKNTNEWKGLRVYESEHSLQLKTTSHSNHSLDIEFNSDLNRFTFYVKRDSDGFAYNCWVERSNTCVWAEGTDNAPNGIKINGVTVTVG